MEKYLRQYFKAEKEGALLFLVVGLVALIASAIMWHFYPNNLVKGTAISLTLIALLQVFIGGSVYFRTNKQVAQLLAQLVDAPASFYQEESQRMEAVMSNFKIIRNVELVVFTLGMGLALAGSIGDLGWFMTGSGVGLCLQSAASLLLDLSGEWRGGLYLHHLKKARK